MCELQASWGSQTDFKKSHLLFVVQSLSRVWLCDPKTVARQAPLSMGFSRQEYWSALPCPPPGDLPDPGTEFTSVVSPALASRFFTTSATSEAPVWRLFLHQSVSQSRNNFLHQSQSHPPHTSPQQMDNLGWPERRAVCGVCVCVYKDKTKHGVYFPRC